MAVEARSAPQTTRATRKENVKTGCRTCKTRRVKCDEAFPECRRCTSSGYVCSGYGIWGGGRAVAGYGGSASRIPIWGCPASVPVKDKDRWLYSYFLSRATSKLVETVSREFWTDIVMPAAHDEACLMHASLAFSSTHRNGTETGGTTARENIPLRHYLQAIQHLREQRFANSEATSIRTAFIACIIFFTTDVFGGQFQSAAMHGQNAIKLLLQYQGIKPTTTGVVTLRPYRNATERWMIEIAVVLQTQVNLQNSLLPSPFIQSAEASTMQTCFKSVKEAWHSLQAIMANIFQLSRNVRSYGEVTTYSSLLAFKTEQGRMQSCLDAWLCAVESSESISQECEQSIEWRKYYTIIRGYHIQASIMLARCPHSAIGDDESAYDTQHMTQFEALLGRMAGLCRIARSQLPTWEVQPSPQSPLQQSLGRSRHDYCSSSSSISSKRTSPSAVCFSSCSSASRQPPTCTNIAALHTTTERVATTTSTPSLKKVDLNHSLLDLGWIPLLFFLATKCRVHRIRVQAARLLSKSNHREGIWDSQFTALVAHRLIELEEGDFYTKGLGNGYDPEPSAYELYELPTRHDLALPRIGTERRLRGVEIRVEGEPVERVMLVAEGPLPWHVQKHLRERGQHEMSGGAWGQRHSKLAGGKVVVAVYDVTKGLWW